MSSENNVMKPRIAVIDGEVTTTSLAVAEHFGKRHDDVLKRIRSIDCSHGFRLRNFAESSYLNEQGKSQPMYRISRDGFAFLAMGFTGKAAARWKEAYINAFNTMDRELTRRVQAEQQRPALASPSADLLLRLNYALDQEFGQAAVLHLLIQSGALDDWIAKTYRQMEAELNGFLSRNGAQKAMVKLIGRGLVEAKPGKSERATGKFHVLAEVLQQVLLSVADLEAPGIEPADQQKKLGKLH